MRTEPDIRDRYRGYEPFHSYFGTICAVGMVLLISFMVSGCDVADIPPSSIAPICRALVGPIKYNTTNTMSQRYAAYLLSLDIHQRNEIGRKLGCPQYK